MVSSTGKLYICENHFCFFASVIGVNVKKVVAVEEVDKIAVGDGALEINLKGGKGKDLRFSKFSGGKEAFQRAVKLITQTLGEEKVVKARVDPKEQEKSDAQAAAGSEEVNFENFFGTDLKEVIRVPMPFSAEKVAQVLLGPKVPVHGFELVVPSLGMEFIRADDWEENQKSGNWSRKFIYAHKRTDQLFLNRELFEQVQTFGIKG